MRTLPWNKSGVGMCMHCWLSRVSSSEIAFSWLVQTRTADLMDFNDYEAARIFLLLTDDNDRV